MIFWTILKVCFVLTVAIPRSSGSTTSFTAAVYEHVVISAENATKNFTRDEAFELMSKNLDVFEEQIKIASQQDVKMIVFPEYAITGFDHSRDSMVPFLEDIPDPGDWNPCQAPDRFPDVRVLVRLSCLARQHNMYVTVNMGDIKYCDQNADEKCPPDGRYQFNTNVIFDDKGVLISRYHKYNLYDESEIFDPSPTIEYSYFDTPYGRFGTVVCFDLLHYYPTQELLGLYDVDHLVVTSAWNVFYPFIIPTQMYSGLAKRNHINVIASNVRNHAYVMAGSGIFGHGVAVLSDTEYTNPGGVLLVTELDAHVRSYGEEIELEPLYLGQSDLNFTNKTYDGAYDYGMNMSFAVLHKHKTKATVCQKDVCCAVNYSFKKHAHERFILSACDFSMNDPGVVHMQFCAVHRCESKDLSTCGRTVLSANSTFEFIKIQAFFQKALVFPFVATSPYSNMTIDVEMGSYKFDKDNAILESSSFKHPLLAAVIFNTVYTEAPHIAASSLAPPLQTSYPFVFLCFLVYAFVSRRF